MVWVLLAIRRRARKTIVAPAGDQVVQVMNMRAAWSLVTRDNERLDG
jgi:hypothetical protein